MNSIVRTTFVALFLTLGAVMSSASRADPSEGIRHWEQFRELVPHHFQDWILAGTGPRYVLIYAEPPPASSLDGYAEILRTAFRGYRSHQVQTRQLGHNGEVSDLVVNLDYTFAGEAFRSALEVDLQALSTAIYGTAHGARFIALSALVDRPPSDNAPPPIHVSANQLFSWTHGNSDRLTFFSPEGTWSGELESLFEKRRTGRFLTLDNSLVALLVDLDRPYQEESIRDVRHYTIDADYVLGGIVDDQRRMVAVLGRARQFSLVDFPALRVEDVFNAIAATDRGPLAHPTGETTFPGH